MRTLDIDEQNACGFDDKNPVPLLPDT